MHAESMRETLIRHCSAPREAENSHKASSHYKKQSNNSQAAHSYTKVDIG